LDDCCDYVGGDEDPEDEGGAEGRVSGSDTAYEDGEDGVDGGGEEDGGGDYEEVLEDEIDYTGEGVDGLVQAQNLVEERGWMVFWKRKRNEYLYGST
jgi:hypothetical protein